MLERLYNASVTLESMTDRGRMVPELQREDVRELLVDSWRLVYRERARRSGSWEFCTSAARLSRRSGAGFVDVSWPG